MRKPVMRAHGLAWALAMSAVFWGAVAMVWADWGAVLLLAGVWACIWLHVNDQSTRRDAKSGSTVKIEPRVSRSGGVDHGIPPKTHGSTLIVGGSEPGIGTEMFGAMASGGGGPGAYPGRVSCVVETAEILVDAPQDSTLPAVPSLHKTIRDGLSPDVMPRDEAETVARVLVPLVRAWRNLDELGAAGQLKAARQMAAMWRDEAARLRVERDEAASLRTIEIPGPVSRETLDRVREVFETAPASQVILMPHVDEERGFAAQALAARVTPDLLSLPIPTVAREILEELRALCSDEQPEGEV